MKYKRYLTAFITGSMVVTNIPVNSLAEEITSIESSFIQEIENEDTLETENNEEITDEIAENINGNFIVESENNSTIEYDTEINEFSKENDTMEESFVDTFNLNSALPTEDGIYKGNIFILNENTDAESMAASYFITSDVDVTFENGEYKVKLEYSTDLIKCIAQEINGEYNNFEIINNGENKYVVVAINDITQPIKIQLTVQMGNREMAVVARLILDCDSLIIDSETSESTTEAITETTTYESSENKSEISYSVPLKMINAANPTIDSMGNGAIDGDAIVTIKDGKSIIDIKFKAVSVSGLYGHLLNMWSYPITDTMNYNWWNDSNYETPCEIIEYYNDFGLEYTSGNNKMYEFPRAIRIERNAENENSIYIRISVDAMAGFDQVARLDLDWDNAQIIENGAVETIVSAPIITASKTEANNNEKVTVTMKSTTDDASIYYTTDGSEPSTNSTIYDSAITIETPSVYGGDVVIKAVAVKEGLINSSVISEIITFGARTSEVIAENKDILAYLEAVTGSVVNGSTSSITEVSGNDTIITTALGNIISNAQNIKAMDLDFTLEENAKPLLLSVDITNFDSNNTKLYKVTGNTYKEIEFKIIENILTSEINETGIYIIADLKNSTNNDANIENMENGKYWLTFNLWNATLDQESMGNSAFENNREALVTINNGVATVEIATNPVSVSGYSSALMDIQSSEVDIYKVLTGSFTTNTKYDGTEHTFTYISKFAFETTDFDKEYINVKINVPYTPMDGISASASGLISARLKLDWSSLEKTDDNTTLVPDSSTASGVTGSGGSAVSTTSNNTGIKIMADEFVFEDGTDFETTQITEGEVFDTANSLLTEEFSKFRLYNIIAKYENEEVQPSGQVKIYIPVGENDSENIAIYRITESIGKKPASKTLLEYELSLDKKYYVITVKELGLYAVAEFEKSEEEKVLLIEENKEINKTVEKITFNDIDNHWAKDSIMRSVSIGFFTGVTENEFAPNVTATRAMVVTILGRLNGADTNIFAENTFKDVTTDDYFYSYVMWAVKNGITSGINETTFGSNTNIRREQMAVMLYNFAVSQNITLNSIYSNINFTDADNISSWAEKSINSLVRSGIIKGRTDGSFDPKGTVTRAEIATMLIKFIDEYMPEKNTNLEE